MVSSIHQLSIKHNLQETWGFGTEQAAKLPPNQYFNLHNILLSQYGLHLAHSQP